MSKRPKQKNSLLPQSGFYEIRIWGSLDSRWQDWFEGLTVRYTNSNETIFSGRITDQAALHGMLAKIRDLNLILLSINRKDFL